MADDFLTPENFNMLPLPVLIAEQNTGRILYANNAAVNMGLQAGQPYDETPIGIEPAPDAQSRSVCVMTSGRTLHGELRETAIRFEGRNARLIAFTLLREEGDSLSEWDICAIFAGSDKTNKTGEYLRLTGKYAGAFSAALYEMRSQRYVLRDEWRSRRSVSIPTLHRDFMQHIEAETEQLRKTKRAADVAVLPYTKMHGTKGVAVYFFDSSINKDKKERLARFTALYGAFAFDSIESSRLVLHRGVSAMEQGFAVWNQGTRALLYSNNAYRHMFGNDNHTINHALGKSIRGHVSHETISDGHGRYFDVTHTVCGNRSQGVISTIIIDSTAYIKVQRRLDMMAHTDALTGLFNRRAGLDYLEQSYAQCKRTKRPLTVCFADIDGLKHINDTWGHGAGDVMIQSVSTVIKKYVGEMGAVCRLGGDEFVIILPNVTLTQATLLTTQISREAERCFVGDRDRVTVSFGFKQAEFIAEETAQTLVSIADMEMYREKNSKSR